MFAQKLLLPVLGATAVLAATQATLCSQPTATITNGADAAALAQCTSISGTIVISPDAAGSLDLSGPKEIKGDLVAQNAGNLIALTSNSIQSIGGTFNLFNLTTLSTLSFDKITSASTILWSALPALSQLTFPEFISEASSVTIENTVLTSLDGINLDTVDVFDINNNRRLTTISTQVGSVGTSISFASNGFDLAIDLPNLEWAANATFRNVSSLKIPSLAVINGTLTFDENTFTSFAAPNLTTVGDLGAQFGSLTFNGNAGVKNVTFPLLKSIAGANQIANNTALQTISFPALTTVGGAIDFAGNFTTPNLPALKMVVGGFHVESTQQIDCSSFAAEAGHDKVLQGSYVCMSTATPTTLSGGTGGNSGSSTTSSSSSSSPTKSGNAAASFGVNEAVAGLSLLGGLLQMLL